MYTNVVCCSLPRFIFKPGNSSTSPQSLYYFLSIWNKENNNNNKRNWIRNLSQREEDIVGLMPSLCCPTILSFSFLVLINKIHLCQHGFFFLPPPKKGQPEWWIRKRIRAVVSIITHSTASLVSSIDCAERTSKKKKSTSKPLVVALSLCCYGHYFFELCLLVWCLFLSSFLPLMLRWNSIFIC